MDPPRRAFEKLSRFLKLLPAGFPFSFHSDAQSESIFFYFFPQEKENEKIFWGPIRAACAASPWLGVLVALCCDRPVRRLFGEILCAQVKCPFPFDPVRFDVRIQTDAAARFRSKSVAPCVAACPSRTTPASFFLYPLTAGCSTRSQF